MSDEFDPRESVTLIFGPASDRRTRQLAYDFLKQNHERIVARLPPDSGSGLVRIAGSFCDAEHRADAASFFAERAARAQGGPRTLAQTLEGIDLCTARRAAQQPSVLAFLKAQ
jgi:alanyl aminopeptidase